MSEADRNPDKKFRTFTTDFVKCREIRQVPILIENNVYIYTVFLKALENFISSIAPDHVLYVEVFLPEYKNTDKKCPGKTIVIQYHCCCGREHKSETYTHTFVDAKIKDEVKFSKI